MNMLNKFNFLLSCFSLVCLSTMLEAQPLQYFDVKDSVNLREINVHYTSDAGWVNVGTTADSAIIVIKYDHCGRQLYTKKFKVQNYVLSDMRTTMDKTNPSLSDTILITAIAKDSLSSGIFCLELHPYKGDVRLPKITAIPNDTIFMNPCISVSGNQRLISFNSGSDSSKLSGHVILLDGSFQQTKSVLLDSNKLVKDIIIKRNGEIVISVDSNLIYGLNDQLDVQYAAKLDSQFIHFNRGLAYATNNEVICSGHLVDAKGDGIILVRIDKEGKSINHSPEAYTYDAKLEPRITSFIEQGQGSNGYLMTFSKKANSLRKDTSDLAIIRFNSDLTIRNTAFFSRSHHLDYIKSISSDYSVLEENIVFAGVILADSILYFNSKLANDLRINDMKCISAPFNFTYLVPDLKQDTFKNAKLSIVSIQGNNSSIFLKSDSISLRRECTYFDFKQGAAMEMGCVGDIKVLRVQPILYSSQDLSNPYVLFNWTGGKTNSPRDGAFVNVTIPSDALTVTTKYCDEISTLTYNLAELDCIQFPNIFVPSSDDVINKDYNPVYSMMNSANINNIEFEIFNRWGHKVFAANDKNAKWDGMVDGNPAPSDTYIYRMVAIYLNGEVRKYKGTFTLIR